MRRRGFFAGSVLIGAQLFSATAAIPQSRVGVNAAIRNEVKMKTAKDAAPRPAVKREPVHLGDLIESGRNSGLQVLLLDRSVFTVGANARMVVDRFVYDPARGTGSVAASVARGAFRFMSGTTARQAGQVSLRTPVASIGVRGTIVELLVGQDAIDALASVPQIGADAKQAADPMTASIIVLRGPGPNRSGNDRVGAIDVSAGGETVAVNTPGFVFVGGPGQAPLGPFKLSSELDVHLDTSLRTTPTPQAVRSAAAQSKGHPSGGSSGGAGGGGGGAAASGSGIAGLSYPAAGLLLAAPIAGLVAFAGGGDGGGDDDDGGPTPVSP